MRTLSNAGPGVTDAGADVRAGDQAGPLDNLTNGRAGMHDIDARPSVPVGEAGRRRFTVIDDERRADVRQLEHRQPDEPEHQQLDQLDASQQPRPAPSTPASTSSTSSEQPSSSTSLSTSRVVHVAPRRIHLDVAPAAADRPPVQCYEVKPATYPP